MSTGLVRQCIVSLEQDCTDVMLWVLILFIAGQIVNLYVVPRLNYGAKTWSKAARHLDFIKRFHDRTLKIIQGLPTRTASVGASILLCCLPSTARTHQDRLAL